jgi:protein-tyrosine-phosphatase
MKTFFVAVTAVLILNSAFAEEHRHEKSAVTEENNHPKSSLVLNHGKKWPVDQVMKKNMDAIHQQFKIFNALSKSKKTSKNEAHKLSAVISVSAQNIISKCKMEPKQDEVFHIILADLLTVASDLENTEKIDPALKNLARTLRSYSEYFDHSLLI